MGDPSAVAFAVGGVLLIVGLVAGSYWYEKKRTEALYAWAASRQLVPMEEGHLLQELGRFKLLNQGHSRSVRNVVRGQREQGQLTVFDFSYVTGGGRNRTTHKQTVVVLQTPGRMTAPFFIRRQRAILDAIGKVFGGQDINFEEDAQFSKGWVLQGEEESVRRVFTPRLREFFKEQEQPLVIEVQQDRLMAHLDRRLKVDDLDGLVTTVTNLRRHWA